MNTSDVKKLIFSLFFLKYLILFWSENAIFLENRLLYITEGKYWNQLKKFRKFRVVLSSGSHETGSTAKKK